MSWTNPSPSEAEEEYSYYKSKYNAAAQRKNASEREEKSYSSQRASAAKQVVSLTKDKLNFEERLLGLGIIIKMLDGTGMLNNVPNHIEKVTTKLSDADNSYKNCIRMTGGAASLADAFAVKSVEADANSGAALEAYKAEKARLAQAIQELKSQIASAESEILTLTRRIAACNAEQASLRTNMNAYAYEMNHYRKYMD